jgi:hypothetical protein
MKKRDKRTSKKAVAVENLVWWMIAIAVLAIMIILAVVLKDKLWGIGAYIKDLFRFGR